MKVAHPKSNDDRFTHARQKFSPPRFVTILARVERVHLQNRLKGELTGDVA